MALHVFGQKPIDRRGRSKRYARKRYRAGTAKTQTDGRRRLAQPGATRRTQYARDVVHTNDTVKRQGDV
jgi:hypothetical protein